MTLRTDLAARGIEVGERPRYIDSIAQAGESSYQPLATYAVQLERALAEMVRRDTCEACRGLGWHEGMGTKTLLDPQGDPYPSPTPIQIECERCYGTGRKA